MVKKGLSLDQKRDIVLALFHENDEVFQLKEMEKKAAAKGVTLQSVKEVVQSLVDDDLVHQVRTADCKQVSRARLKVAKHMTLPACCVPRSGRACIRQTQQAVLHPSKISSSKLTAASCVSMVAHAGENRHRQLFVVVCRRIIE